MRSPLQQTPVKRTCGDPKITKYINKNDLVMKGDSEKEERESEREKRDNVREKARMNFNSGT